MSGPLKTWRRVRLTLVRETAPAPYLAHGGAVVELVRQLLGDDTREQFVAVYLDTKHKPIAVHTVSIGSIDATTVHPREVFTPAVGLSAAAVVVAHNHPSGDPTPSADDRRVTARLKDAGELLGIQVLDHLVLGSARFYSFADEGFHVLAVTP